MWMYRYDSRTNCPATTSDGVDKCFGDGCYTSTFFFAFGVCAVSTVVAVIVRSTHGCLQTHGALTLVLLPCLVAVSVCTDTHGLVSVLPQL